MISEDDPRKASLMLASMIALEGHADMDVTPLTQSAEMAHALATYAQNMAEAIALLRDANPDARIILATQYNPYRHFTGLYASVNTSMSPLNLDFHPNAAGHAVLADAMLSVLLGAE